MWSPCGVLHQTCGAGRRAERAQAVRGARPYSKKIVTKAHFILALNDPAGLSWVLTNKRMAFSAGRLGEARRLRPGDRAFVYSTLSGFKGRSPRGQIIADVTFETPVRELEVPVAIAGRHFVAVCELQLTALASAGEGVPLAELVDELSAFPKPKYWGGYLQRALLPLSEEDATLLEWHFSRVSRSPGEALPTYSLASTSEESTRCEPT